MVATEMEAVTAAAARRSVGPFRVALLSSSRLKNASQLNVEGPLARPWRRRHLFGDADLPPFLGPLRPLSRRRVPSAVSAAGDWLFLCGLSDVSPNQD